MFHHTKRASKEINLGRISWPIRVDFPESASIYLFALATFFTQLPSFYGEDIVNARNNFLVGEKTDFWGGMSTLIYAYIPDFGFRWQIWLAIFQIALVAIGLHKMRNLGFQAKCFRYLFYLLSYSCFMFGSQMTRDGLMFSLLICGVGLLISVTRKDSHQGFLVLSVLIICIALSFRPWISLALIPIVWIVTRHRKQRRLLALSFSLSLAVLPLSFEFIAVQGLGLKDSYPQQQVMLMDVASTYCYSNNSNSGFRAREALMIFPGGSSLADSACQFFRPDTWLSLTKNQNASTENLETDLWLISAGEEVAYKKLESSWIDLILHDPITYIQNKVIFAGKLIIGSDTRSFGLSSTELSISTLSALYKAPYDLAITLHLYSIIALMFWLFLIPLKRFLKSKTSDFYIDRVAVTLIFGALIWTILSAIAYIGSNGRYTYAYSLLALTVYFSIRKSIWGDSHK
jgi:hypothetical protein